jgi:energy-converting hydrogenase A subunit D
MQEEKREMIDILLYLFGAIALIGAVSAAVKPDPFDKLISLGVVAGGVIPFLVDRGYLDVAITVALIAPVTTIIILLVCRREET